MNVLFVANFSPGTGYAWTTIQAVFRGVAERLEADGVRVFVSYPSPSGSPETFEGTDVEFVTADYDRVRRSPSHAVRFLALLRRRRIRLLYLTDRQKWSPLYPLFHAAGVRRIVIHDRTSGARTARAGVLGWVKRMLHRTPMLAADRYIGVSDYVRRRLVDVNGVPEERTFRVYNGIDLTRFRHPPSDLLEQVEPRTRGRPVVFMAARAHRVKGVHVLLEAAALIDEERAEAEAASGNPAFVFVGDGPELPDLRRRAEQLDLQESFFFLGRRDDVPRLLPCATLAAVPVLWQEAFGLIVVEAMAAGLPVVASRAGAIPELVDHGETGLLVPPGDARRLADAIRILLRDDDRRATMAARARREAQRFSIERTVAGVHEVLRSLLSELGSSPAEGNDYEGAARASSESPRTTSESPRA